MDIEQIRNHCVALKGVTEDIKWEHNLCFLLNDKIFLMVGLEQVPTKMSAKVKPSDFDTLCEDENIIQAAYLAKGQWISVRDISLLHEKQGKKLISDSYELIFQKLTKKAQKEILSLE